MRGKCFCHEEKTLKKEKNLEIFNKDNNSWQKEKLNFIWIGGIKKNLSALKWIKVTNQRKTG